jgi:hypothetical protein
VDSDATPVLEVPSLPPRSVVVVMAYEVALS